MCWIRLQLPLALTCVLPAGLMQMLDYYAMNIKRACGACVTLSLWQLPCCLVACCLQV
jgi:hypothetical protein